MKKAKLRELLKNREVKPEVKGEPKKETKKKTKEVK